MANADQGREYSPMSSDQLTLEKLDARLRRIELDLGVEDSVADCGTFIPCKRLKSCGSFSLTTPPTTGSTG